MDNYKQNEENKALYDDMMQELESICTLIAKSWTEPLTPKEQLRIDAWILRGEGRKELLEKMSDPKNVLLEALKAGNGDTRKMFDDALANDPELRRRKLRNLNIKNQFIDYMVEHPDRAIKFIEDSGCEE